MLNRKLMVAIIMIDISSSMKGKEKIEEANLCYSKLVDKFKRLQEENPELEVKLSTMMIGSTCCWNSELIDITDYKTEFFKSNTEQADYKIAFDELRHKLSRKQFMTHSGYIVAAPTIILITGDTLFTTCENEIRGLLNNGWFLHSNRLLCVIGKKLTDIEKEKCVLFTGGVEGIVHSTSEITDFRYVSMGPPSGRKNNDRTNQNIDSDEKCSKSAGTIEFFGDEHDYDPFKGVNWDDAPFVDDDWV